MTLREKQSIFARLVMKLLLEAHILGYEVTLGHAYRSVKEAKLLGFEWSLHTLKLAIDLNLFRNGKYLRSSSDHEPLGIWWGNQSTDEFTCIWGGRFKKSDGNHYSIKHGGRS